MVELLQNYRTMIVYSIGYLTKVWNYRVVAVQKITPGQDRGRVYRHRLDHDHRRAADGTLFVISAVAFSRQTLLGHIGGMRTKNNSIIQRFVTQGDWLKNILIVGHAKLLANIQDQYTCCFNRSKRIYFRNILIFAAGGIAGFLSAANQVF
jgi:hypothetical protein